MAQKGHWEGRDEARKGGWAEGCSGAPSGVSLEGSSWYPLGRQAAGSAFGAVFQALTPFHFDSHLSLPEGKSLRAETLAVLALLPPADSRHPAKDEWRKAQPHGAEAGTGSGGGQAFL